MKICDLIKAIWRLLVLVTFEVLSIQTMASLETWQSESKDTIEVTASVDPSWAVGSIDQSSEWWDVYASLKATNSYVQSRIDCFHASQSQSVQNFLDGVWNLNSTHTSSSRNIPILVYPFCLDSLSLGNGLGNYFNELSCAMISGAHFISPSVLTKESPQSSLSAVPENFTGNRQQFYHALPRIVINRQARTIDSNIVAANLAKFCGCKGNCWSDKTAPWHRNVPMIRNTIQHAIIEYLKTVPMMPKTLEHVTRLSNETMDLTSRHIFLSRDANPSPSTQAGIPEQVLPLVPDIVIHYRCGDNLAERYQQYGYGILPYYTFLPYIPAAAKNIYVLSDHPARCHSPQLTHRCQQILQGLFHYLVEKLPSDKVIVVKRGKDALLDMARIAYANITFCSPSTFCFFSALASNGTVYMPTTALISHTGVGSNWTSFKHITFFDEPQVLEAVGERDWDGLHKVLRGELK